jgi:hypothetical protein
MTNPETIKMDHCKKDAGREDRVTRIFADLTIVYCGQF